MAIVSHLVITKYVEKHIDTFHAARLASLKGLKLAKVLARKNPYLFKAKNLVTPRALVKALLDAYLSSQEETILGGLLEGLAIFICKKAYRAHGKSTTEGIDLEFEREGKRYIIAIKSGPNWGNSSQIKKMKANFKQAKIIYDQGADGMPVIAINGCCYGRQKMDKENKGDYFKKCGQSFWKFISGDDELYTKIVEPLGHKAKERNDEFLAQYKLVIDAFTNLFRADFCDTGNRIDWEKLTQFNSSENPPQLKMQKKAKKIGGGTDSDESNSEEDSEAD